MLSIALYIFFHPQRKNVLPSGYLDSGKIKKLPSSENYNLSHEV